MMTKHFMTSPANAIVWFPHLHLSGSSLNQVADPEVIDSQGQVPKEPPLPLLSPSQTRKVRTGVSWKAEYAKLGQEIQQGLLTVPVVSGYLISGMHAETGVMQRLAENGHNHHHPRCRIVSHIWLVALSPGWFLK
jgi:hypothetical protein